MRFVKMQATGNDYVYVTENETEGKDLSALAAEVSDRRTGIGSDGLIVLSAAGGEEEKEYELKMRIFNADGSEGVTCGNGVRCAAKFAYEKMGITANPMRVLTGSGVRLVRMMESDGKIVYAEAEMGKPHIFALDPRQRACMEEVGLYVDYRSIIPVNVGNLHLVFFEENEKSPLMLTKLVESGGAFPDGINIEQARAIPGGFAVRVTERGSGETFSCGSGAVAVAYAALQTARVSAEDGERGVGIGMRGGRLQVRFEGETAYLRGKIGEVFTGNYEI